MYVDVLFQIIFKLFAMTIELHFFLHVTNGYTYMSSNTHTKIFISTHILISTSLVYKQIIIIIV